MQKTRQGKLLNYFSPHKAGQNKAEDSKRPHNEEDDSFTNEEPTLKRSRVDPQNKPNTNKSSSQLSSTSQKEVDNLLAELNSAPDMLDDDFGSYSFQNKNNTTNNNNPRNTNNSNSNNNNTNNNINNNIKNSSNTNNTRNGTPTKPTAKINEKPVSTQQSRTPQKTETAGGTGRGEKREERFSFLTDLRDSQRRSPDDADYDPHSLFIPNSEYMRLTPFERQYWDVKRKFFDSVVFFKKGKFYELYETDADIGHRLLDLKMTDRVNMRMVGVPESSFSHWASKLLQMGYKVAKVDELESGLGKEMRQAKEGGAKKGTDVVIRRELSCVLTAGTLSDPSLLPSHSPHFLLVLQESGDRFGFVLLDAAGGTFHLGLLEDDGRATALETLLLQISPKEIIYPKGVNQNALTLIRRLISLYKIQTHSFSSDFFTSANDTLRAITMGGYFPDGDIPASLKSSLEVLGGADTAVLTLEALGGCIKYLQSLKQDETLLGGAEFKAYSISPSSNLILDGTTLQNLEILSNTTDGGPRGSLLALLDQCCSSFGKRLFRSWLIRPLCDATAINDRLDAVEDLLNEPGLIDTITAFLGKLPDLERSVARIRSKTCKFHEFMNCLRGFETAWDGFSANLPTEVQSVFSSSLLKQSCVLPDLEPALNAMHSYFDWDEAKDVTTITPQRGLNPNLDEAIDTVQSLLDKLAAHLKEVKSIMRCQVDYKDIGKERYQIEIPVDAVQRKKDIPKEWILMSQTKSVKRFHTPTIVSLLKPLAEAQYTAEIMKKEILVELQKRFNEFGEKWDTAIQRMACLDALISLAKVSSRSGNMCRPIFVDKNSRNNVASQLKVSGDVISLKQSIHPCVVPLAGNDVIPNDIKLGEDAPLVLVLTGPNMGGKSTLLRQTCITVIMAQMGCFVPASNCVLSPVDRIFTRLGARDDIVTGQSTFMVELQETGNMLNNATSSSLVILDELGRGTSTFDGYAIAYSVLAHIANTTKCRTMFSTHYHSLTEEVGRLPSVGVYHMDSIVDEEKKEVAFLYRLTKGDCPRSYGLHVANMASIPKSILDEAQKIADTLHIAILQKITKRVCELLDNDKLSENEKYESLLNLWRAAKGRLLSWNDNNNNDSNNNRT